MKLSKHKCPYCPKEYQSLNDLDGHLQKIHGLSPANIRKVSEAEKSEFVRQCLKILDELKKKKEENKDAETTV